MLATKQGHRNQIKRNQASIHCDDIVGPADDIAQEDLSPL
jgi:hypothetical protein